MVWGGSSYGSALIGVQHLYRLRGSAGREP